MRRPPLQRLFGMRTTQHDEDKYDPDSSVMSASSNESSES